MTDKPWPFRGGQALKCATKKDWILVMYNFLNIHHILIIAASLASVALHTVLVSCDVRYAKFWVGINVPNLSLWCIPFINNSIPCNVTCYAFLRLPSGVMCSFSDAECVFECASVRVCACVCVGGGGVLWLKYSPQGPAAGLTLPRTESFPCLFNTIKSGLWRAKWSHYDK